MSKFRKESVRLSINLIKIIDLKTSFLYKSGKFYVSEYRKDNRDPIEFLLYLTLKPMQFKIVLLILGYVTIEYCFALILTLYKLISAFDKTVLLRHGSFCGIEIFVSECNPSHS